MSSGLKKSPSFNTIRQKGPAGVSSGLALKPYPTWDFEFSLDSVVGHESTAETVVAQFLGTYMATAGGANLFLFTDPQDHSAANAQFGTGDGVTTAFQLSRNIFGAVDIIQNLFGTPNIFVGGVLTVPTSISNTGVVTLAAAPANNVALTWSGDFYYLCRFSEDTIDATRAFTIGNGSRHQ
jgi:uncharacterized protein (TIGR02217 family)